MIIYFCPSFQGQSALSMSSSYGLICDMRSKNIYSVNVAGLTLSEISTVSVICMKCQV